MSDQCVFCDTTQFKERLIGEYEDFLIIAALGQISKGYTLLVSKRHIPCMGACAPPEIIRLEAAQEKIHHALLTEYNVQVETILEHGITGQTVTHAHLHFIPAACNITKRVRRDFPDKEITPIQGWNELQTLYGESGEPYLLWRGDDAVIRVCKNPHAPPQYLRIVVAEALGRPERANWRTMNSELDKRLWQNTVTRLKPYFS